MKNVVWTRGTGGLEGEFQSASEVDFYIDQDMIHIADTKVARRYGDFFIRNIHKFEEVLAFCNTLWNTFTSTLFNPLNIKGKTLTYRLISIKL